MKSLLVFLALAAAILASAATPSDTDPGWPTEITHGGARIVIYQPQAESWKKNKLQARSAVTVTMSGASQPVYGIVSLIARTEVDKENRVVTLQDLKVTSASFPTAGAQQSNLERAVRESVEEWPATISLDRLMADLSITEAEMDNESVAVKNTPPRIIFSTTPSVLIQIDGQPFYRPVAGTPYTHVTNTPALLLFNPSARRFYLDGQNRWMTATSLNGPWTADPDPPADLNLVKEHLLKDEQKDPHDQSHDPAMPPGNSPPPAVYVTMTPAELLQTKGAPQFSPIPKTDLTYVTNTDNDLFMNVKTQDYYTLLAGRWFQAKSVNGPWSYVPPKQLPRDFAKIPDNSPKARVLASVPGTEAAKEAAVAAQIPQTATVKRKAAKLKVTYDGAPQFQPIEATGMEYATNTPDDVIMADGRYYAVHDAIWFVADSPYGPWAVADSVPPVIYTIPPSCPLYHDRYVYVYGSTPDYVYEGYTPGYEGAYYSDGVVVFGTGWDYPGWYGDQYYGWPWTWGFGWQYGYWGGGWFNRPVGNPWWYHNPGYMGRVYYNHYNSNWHPGDWGGFQNNVNVYHRWGPSTVLGRNAVQGIAARNALTRQAALSPRYNGDFARGAGAREDLYAGRDGRVYQYRQNNWLQRGTGGAWNRVDANRGLEMQRQARSFGAARFNEFRGYGGFGGMAQLPGGFGGLPRTSFGGFGGRPGGFAGRPGGFGGGFRR